MISRSKMWKAQEKNEEYKNVRWLMWELTKINGFVLKPIILNNLFFNHMQQNHKSKMNAEQARNMAEIFSVLCHVYHIAGRKYYINLGLFAWL